MEPDPEEDEAGVRVEREVSASEADPFSDAGGMDEDGSGEDLHDEAQAVPMGCAGGGARTCAPRRPPPVSCAAAPLRCLRARARSALTQRRACATAATTPRCRTWTASR